MTSKLDIAGLVERLRGYEDCCPFCGHDPYHYVDNGVGMERVAVTCCGLGIALFQHGDEQLQEELDLRREAADLIEALTQSAAPDMGEPVGYLFRLRYGDHWSQQLMYSEALPKEGDYKELVPLYCASQLSALQERVERAETRVEQLENSKEWQRLTTALEAAEARVAEAEAALSQIQNLADMLIAAHDPGADLSAMSGHEAQRRVHAFVREVAPAIEAIATAARAALAHNGEGRS